MRLRLKSIGTKIMLPMVFVILITGVANITVVQRNLQKTLAISLKEKGFSVTKHLAVASLEPILIDDRQYLHELLDNEKLATHDLSYAFIIDTDDNIIVHTFSDGFPL